MFATNVIKIYKAFFFFSTVSSIFINQHATKKGTTWYGDVIIW